MRTEAEMKCDWTRELNIDGLKAERDAAVDEAWRLNAVEMLKKSAETERDAAIARADAAEQLVAELRAVLVRRHAHDVAGGLCDTPERCSCDVIVTATLEASAPVANRWCLASERDAAIARAEKAEAELAQRPEATGL
jgi:hypothetical protein